MPFRGPPAPPGLAAETLACGSSPVSAAPDGLLYGRIEEGGTCEPSTPWEPYQWRAGGPLLECIEKRTRNSRSLFGMIYRSKETEANRSSSRVLLTGRIPAAPGGVDGTSTSTLPTAISSSTEAGTRLGNGSSQIWRGCLPISRGLESTITP